MAKLSKRFILRWIHIVFGLMLVAFVYGPQAETQKYIAFFRYIYMPVVLLSGLFMWKGHALKGLLKGKGAKDASKAE